MACPLCFYILDSNVIFAEHSQHVEISHTERILHSIASQEWLDTGLASVLEIRRRLFSDRAMRRKKYLT